MLDCIFITVNYHSEENIKKLLNSIKNLTLSNFNLIIIDSSNTFDSNILDKNILNKIKIIQIPDNRGYAYAANIGLRTALNLNTKHVWLLNPDTEIDKNSFKYLEETSENNKNCLIGSLVLSKDRISGNISIWGNGGFFDNNGQVSMGQSEVQNDSIECNYVPGCSIFMSSETLIKIGFIPDDYFLYFEETAWALRSAKKYNTKCLIDQRSIVYHEVYEKKLEENYRVYFYNRNELLFKLEAVNSFFEKIYIILNSIKKLLNAFFSYFKSKNIIFLVHAYSVIDFLRFLFIQNKNLKLKISKNRLKQFNDKNV